MQLEQNFYQEQEERYTSVNLECMSASSLYTGRLPPFKAGGAGFDLPRHDPLPLLDISGYGDLTIKYPKIGMTLPGGLTIKDLTSNSAVFQEDLGGVGNIYVAHPDGGGSTRFYGLGQGKKKVTKKIWEKNEDE